MNTSLMIIIPVQLSIRQGGKQGASSPGLMEHRPPQLWRREEPPQRPDDKFHFTAIPWHSTEAQGAYTLNQALLQALGITLQVAASHGRNRK